MNKWTGLVRVCAFIAGGGFLEIAHAAGEEHGTAIEQRHFDAYCVYLLSQQRQQARAEESGCMRSDGGVLTVKTGGVSSGCNQRGIFKRKPASRTRYTLRYARP